VIIPPVGRAGTVSGLWDESGVDAHPGDALAHATGAVQKSGVKMEPTRQPSSEWTMPITPSSACIESSSKFS
jgi:hypothetical protein